MRLLILNPCDGSLKEISLVPLIPFSSPYFGLFRSYCIISTESTAAQPAQDQRPISARTMKRNKIIKIKNNICKKMYLLGLLKPLISYINSVS